MQLRLFIGLAIMTYEPLYHALQMISKYLILEAFLNTSTQLLENTNVMPTIRWTKIFRNNLPSNRNLVGNLNA